MKGIVWILALILTIPTYGISLIVAFVLASALDKQGKIILEEKKAQFKEDIIAFYHEYRKKQGLELCDIPSHMLFGFLREKVIVIKNHFDKYNLSIADEKYVSYLAVKIQCYAGGFHPDDYKVILEDTLSSALAIGLKRTFEQPYVKSKYRVD